MIVYPLPKNFAMVRCLVGDSTITRQWPPFTLPPFPPGRGWGGGVTDLRDPRRFGLAGAFTLTVVGGTFAYLSFMVATFAFYSQRSNGHQPLAHRLMVAIGKTVARRLATVPKVSLSRETPGNSFQFQR